MTSTSPSDVQAGRIVGVFGLRGECKIDATRLGADALQAGSVVVLRLVNGSQCELRVRSARLHKGRPLVTFEGFDDVNAAQRLVGATIAMNPAAVVLAPGEYLDADLAGCALVDLAGIAIGKVVAVEHYPSQDMLVVGAARALVPLVRDFVKAVDIASKRIIVDLPPGLLDDRDAAIV